MQTSLSLPPSDRKIGSSSFVKMLKHLTSHPTQPTTLEEALPSAVLFQIVTSWIGFEVHELNLGPT